MLNLLLIVCTVLLTVFSCLLVMARRKEKIEAIEAMLPLSENKKKLTILQSVRLFGFQNTKNLVLILAIPAGLMGAFVGGLTKNSPVIYGVLGAFLPYIIVSIRQKMFMKAYWEDAKQSIQFAAAIFAAGGSLEDWMYEVLPRLSGPLKKEFQIGVTNHKRGISITYFLESLAQRSPHSYFQYVVIGLLANYRSSGDQKEFLSQVMDDMANQERFTRIMESERKRNQNMLLFVIGFPVSMYLLFKESVDYTLKNHPYTNIVLLVGILGLVGVLWLGNRLTKSSMN